MGGDDKSPLSAIIILSLSGLREPESQKKKALDSLCRLLPLPSGRVRSCCWI